MAYGRWLISGSWRSVRPPGSGLTWGQLAASWAIATVLVALVFALLTGAGVISGVAVALLWVFAQAAVIAGLVHAARRTTRRTS